MVNSRANKIKYVTCTLSQVVNASTTLVNQNQMVLSVGANKFGFFKVLIKTKGNSTGNLKLKWVIPSGGNMKCSTLASPTAPSAMIDMETEITATLSTSYQHLTFEGWLTTSNAGTFQLQFAQATSNGTDTYIASGSHFAIYEAKT